MKGAKIFCHLDITDAYTHLPVDEKFCQALTLNTPTHRLVQPIRARLESIAENPTQPTSSHITPKRSRRVHFYNNSRISSIEPPATVPVHHPRMGPERGPLEHSIQPHKSRLSPVEMPQLPPVQTSQITPTPRRSTRIRTTRKLFGK
ncbi:hypothetical protein RI129_001527 [Pyrocoelia pectoralis]|uniref:Reverse transcriptase domain-containing protein n=1 Tax=Pyrocoelia pectoralis TaxID=417401 RepID=A0AAN7ZX98_9COLE